MLLLRATAGGLLVFISGNGLIRYHSISPMTLALTLVLAITGSLLLAGYRARVAALLAAITIIADVLISLAAPNPSLFGNVVSTILTLAMVVAVACVGPGAFSVDARLFGRREIVIPASRPHY